jgi:SAM-dependent methyltransferase
MKPGQHFGEETSPRTPFALPLPQTSLASICPACRRLSDFARVEEFGRSSLFHCPDCDLQFWYPREMPDGLWYEGMYSPRDAVLMPLEPGHNYFLSDSNAPAQGELLDVGCGTGNFLVAAREKGYAVTGIELDGNAARFAKERTGLGRVLPLTMGQFAARYPSQKFDVITFFEVLEHQADPDAFLDAVLACLHPRGRIALSVPNRNRWMSGIDVLDYPPNHFLRWSAASLQRFLSSKGFEILTIREQPAGIAHIAQVFNMALRSGMTRRVAGEEEVSFRDLLQMSPEQTADALNTSPSLRRRIVRLLGHAKRLACYLPAFLAYPYIRLRRKKGTYLYCLARRLDEKGLSPLKNEVEKGKMGC